jgi:hypothetical protein
MHTIWGDECRFGRCWSPRHCLDSYLRLWRLDWEYFSHLEVSCSCWCCMALCDVGRAYARAAPICRAAQLNVEKAMIEHKGGCHCGAVTFKVLAPAKIAVTDCNCSICCKSGYLHLIVPADRFYLLRGEESLSVYGFNTYTAKHLFCKTCGIKSFYVPRSHPDGFSVNARCLDQSTIEEMLVKPSNGKEWEKVYPDGRGSFD